MFLRYIHLLWLPTAVVKTLRYNYATVRSRINTVRPLPLNHRHIAKLHLRDLLNLIKSQGFIKLPSWVREGLLEIYWPISIGPSLILLCVQAKSFTCVRVPFFLHLILFEYHLFIPLTSYWVFPNIFCSIIPLITNISYLII